MLLQSNADLPRFFRCSINDWVEVVSCKGETVPVSIALSQIAVLSGTIWPTQHVLWADCLGIR